MSPTATVVSLQGRRGRCDECPLCETCLAHAEGESGTELPVVTRVVRRGERIFRAGDRFESLHVVRSGAFKTTLLSRDGEEQVVGFHLPGELLGLEAIGEGHHAFDAIALDTSSICVVPFESMARHVARGATTWRRLLARMSDKLRREGALLLTLGQRSADERVAAFLLEQADGRRRCGYAADVLNLPMPRADIASYLGLAVETVSRVLTRLQGAGVIEVERSQVRVRDLDELARRAGDLHLESGRKAAH